MFVGCLLMFLVLNRYGFSRKVTGNFPVNSPTLTAQHIPGQLHRIC